MKLKEIVAKGFVLAGVSLVCLTLATPSHATETETLLIDKLTNVFLKLPEGNPTKTKITLRLADLHAERGRLTAKTEFEKGCIECSNGERDRKKALEYYHYVLPQLKGDSRQNVMVQVGHLYEVLGQNTKAISFYQKVLKANSGKGAAEAHFSLAEIYFKQRQFGKAKGHYKSALASESFQRRGLASFRLAWSQYNLGEVSAAVKGLEAILTTPKLLTRGGVGLVNVDQDFKAEVAKDYTVFMAHNSQISLAAIKQVYRLSPDKTRIENVSFLAKELERLGRVQQSQEAWELVVQETGDPQIRMEALVYLAGLQMKGQNKSQILPFLKRAFRNWNSLKTCKDQRVCDELKSRLRNLVFDWNRSEKKNPSVELLEAYEGYFSVEAQDGKAFELASQAATQAKDYSRAYAWSQKAFGLAKENKNKEALLIRRIEIAELAKNQEWLVASQKAYLEKSPQKTKSTEIRYQMAQRAYDNKDYDAAAKQFKALAVASSVAGKLKQQSAEMALDALVLTKNDSLIESWARDFASLFPKNKKRFLGMAGQSVLSQTAAISGAKGSPQEAWKTLNRFDLATAGAEQKKTYLKNKVILARQLKKFDEMNQALRGYLSLKSLSKEEKQFGLENKVWLSELQLNFVEAYSSYKKLKTNKWLELARFADLAEKPSSSYYYEFLKKNTDKDLAFSICVKLIRDAKSFGKKQQVCRQSLDSDKSFFANLLMEIYSGRKNDKQMMSLFKKYGLDSTASAHVLKRGFLISKGEKNIQRLRKHRLDGRSHRVARSLQKRMKLITAFEKTIAKATETQDWLTQTLFLTELQKQYSRFFEEILALPTPKDLTAEEQQQYLSLLSQQAAPYKEKAEQIQFKMDELWKNEAAMDQLYADFHKSSVALQSLLGPQIEKLKTLAGATQATRFDLVYRKAIKKSVPSLALLEAARTQVKQSPMNRRALQNLIQLEEQRGYQPMIIYLNSRLKRMEQGFESQGRAL